jgi:hypothetical protein
MKYSTKQNNKKLFMQIIIINNRNNNYGTQTESIIASQSCTIYRRTACQLKFSLSTAMGGTEGPVGRVSVGRFNDYYGHGLCSETSLTEREQGSFYEEETLLVRIQTSGELSERSLKPKTPANDS